MAISAAFAAAAALIGTAAAAATDQPRLDRLARDLDRVESVRAVKALQAGLALDVEAGRWSGAAARFADDADADWSDGAAVHGRRAIRDRLKAMLGGGRDGRSGGAIHAPILMAPIVTLAPDGDHAKGRWHEVALLGGPGGGAQWSGGIYENDYVRTGGKWRIARLHYYPQLRGAYAGGWHDAFADQKVFPYHYDVASVGVPVTAGDAVTSPGRSMPAGWAARIPALTDADQVSNLQAAYGYYVDRKMWDDVADLFEDGGSYTVEGTGTATGASAIRRALEQAGGPAGLKHGELNDHTQADLLVCVSPDGQHARTRGLELGMTGQNGGKGYWSLALFDNGFVKRGGTWRIASVRMLPRMKADQALGWGSSALVDAKIAAIEPPPFSCQARPVAAPQPVGLDAAELALRRAAARDAIENVSGAFGNYIDDFAWDDLGRLFTATGRREAPGVGFYVGPARITEMERVRYGAMASPRTFVPIHARTQFVIDVAPDGRSAKFRNRLLQFNTALDRPGTITEAMYEDEMALDGGTWRFSSVEVDHQMQTVDYAHGWTAIPEHQGLRLLPPADKLLRDLPPDSPVEGEMFPPFPTIGIMWFHYPNPVSRRRPPYMTPKTAATISMADVRNDK